MEYDLDRWREALLPGVETLGPHASVSFVLLPTVFEAGMVSPNMPNPNGAEGGNGGLGLVNFSGGEDDGGLDFDPGHHLLRLDHPHDIPRSVFGVIGMTALDVAQFIRAWQVMVAAKQPSLVRQLHFVALER